jgi:hypothetical protein
MISQAGDNMLRARLIAEKIVRRLIIAQGHKLSSVTKAEIRKAAECVVEVIVTEQQWRYSARYEPS